MLASVTSDKNFDCLFCFCKEGVGREEVSFFLSNADVCSAPTLPTHTETLKNKGSKGKMGNTNHQIIRGSFSTGGSCFHQ